MILPFSAQRRAEIVAADERFIAVYKPYGMHSVALPREQDAAPRLAEGEHEASDAQTLSSWAATHLEGLSAFPDLRKDYASPGAFPKGDGSEARSARLASAIAECGMLTRLDRETSGLVIFARGLDDFNLALRAQRSQSFEKAYVLACSPQPGEPRGSRPPVFAPQADSASPRYPCIVESRFRSYGPRGSRVACMLDGNVHGGKHALSGLHATVFRLPEAALLNDLPDKPGSQWLQAEIFSGYRHQIRAHSAWRGLPILGDALYGGRPADRLYLECFAVRLTLEDGYRAQFRLYPNAGAWN